MLSYKIVLILTILQLAAFFSTALSIKKRSTTGNTLNFLTRCQDFCDSVLGRDMNTINPTEQSSSRIIKGLSLTHNTPAENIDTNAIEVELFKSVLKGNEVFLENKIKSIENGEDKRNEFRRFRGDMREWVKNQEWNDPNEIVNPQTAPTLKEIEIRTKYLKSYKEDMRLVKNEIRLWSKETIDENIKYYGSPQEKRKLMKEKKGLVRDKLKTRPNSTRIN